MADQHKPLSLLKTTTYPGYQFQATMRYAGRTPGECMRYVVLTVIEWLRQRIGQETCPEALKMPPAAMFMKAKDEDLVSCHVSEGYTLDITSIMKKGIWAVRLREPDMENTGRKAVLGRFFVTRIGIKLDGEDVALGMQIEVLDPTDVGNNVAYAYRPAFVRRLFMTKSLHIAQVDPLLYDKPISLGSPLALKRLEALLADPRHHMPCIFFTHACQQKNVRELVEKLDKCLGLTGQPNSFVEQMNSMDLVPETLEFGDVTMPYNADYAAEHSFGYGRVYVVPDRMFEQFRKRFCSELRKGDILWMEPARFGGMREIIRFDEQSSAADREQIRNDLLSRAHAYSKNKLYDFSGVVFELAARRMELEENISARLQELRNGDAILAEQHSEELYRETENLIALYEDEKTRAEEKCAKLQQDNLSKENKIKALEQQIERLKETAGVLIHLPQGEEFYADERRDLIISILQEAKRTYCAEGSRAEELLEGILQCNDVTGEGKVFFERLKTILYRNKNIKESDVADLKELGFEVSRHQNNHYKLVFLGNTRYTFGLASTSSEVHSMKNAFADITKKLSVYK